MDTMVFGALVYTKFSGLNQELLSALQVCADLRIKEVDDPNTDAYIVHCNPHPAEIEKG
jgi:hypothetical protein